MAQWDVDRALSCKSISSGSRNGRSARGTRWSFRVVMWALAYSAKPISEHRDNAQKYPFSACSRVDLPFFAGKYPDCERVRTRRCGICHLQKEHEKKGLGHRSKQKASCQPHRIKDKFRKDSDAQIRRPKGTGVRPQY